MIKKYLGLSLITASMLVMGCSSDDDGPGDTTGSTTGTTTGSMDTLITVPATVTLPTGVEAPTLNIVETAAGNENLTSLVAAVTRVGLVDTLSNADSTFTVFAPSDTAFSALPDGTVDSMSDEDLTALLNYHVVVGALDGAGVAAGVGSSVATVQGDALPITADANGALSIGGAPISATDVYTTNGIVHIIDTVLIPAAEPDTDGDTVVDSEDNCPAVANMDQLDTDGNGVGDACEPGTTTGTTTGETSTGAVEQIMTDAGNLSGYLAGLATTVNVQSFEDASGLTWTVFAPTDSALAGTAVDNSIVQDSINVNGAFDEAALGAMTEITTNQGKTYAVVNAGGAISVGGFPVTLLSSGNTVVYSIEGVLQ